MAVPCDYGYISSYACFMLNFSVDAVWFNFGSWAGVAANTCNFEALLGQCA